MARGIVQELPMWLSIDVLDVIDRISCTNGVIGCKSDMLGPRMGICFLSLVDGSQFWGVTLPLRFSSLRNSIYFYCSKKIWKT